MSTAVQASGDAGARPRLWRITDRRTFQELRRHGSRARRGPLTVTWLPPSTGSVAPPRVGFVVGKATGGAVIRNRVRRRLRAAAHELLVAGRLPEGTYLLGGTVEVATIPWSELVGRLDATLLAVQPDAPRSASR